MVVWLVELLVGWTISFGTYFLYICGFGFLYKELTMGIYRASKSIDMKGKVAIVTGGNASIGLETARGLAARGAKVVLGCRNRYKGESAVKDIVQSTGNSQVIFRQLDLQDLQSVKNFAETVSREGEKVDILVNNAGIIHGEGYDSWEKGGSHQVTKDNLEIVTQTNHLGHFLLTNLLKESLTKSGGSRVVNVSSMANKGGNIDLTNINYENKHEKADLEKTYHNSKLMNVLFSLELSKRWADLGVTSYSLHPGFVRTAIFDNFSDVQKNLITALGYLVGKNPWQGAQTTLFLCMEPDIEKMAGGFFSDCRKNTLWLSPEAENLELCAGLWTRSEELVGLAKEE